MGSHGGAIAEGQQRILEGYGITPEYVGTEIRSSMAVVELPRGDLAIPVFYDRQAHEADGTIIINRIKPHTSFHGRYESGLMKMMAIGLGKQAQALAIHRLGPAGLRDIMPAVARQVLQHGNVILGLAIIENAYDEILKVQAVLADRIPDEEPLLLDLARANMPLLPVSDLDILIVDEMGKDISGLGMDTNVIGRLRIRGQPEPERPNIGIIIVRDLSAGSHGNAVGVGLADIITRRLFEKIDFKATYENALTSTFTERAKVPIIAETDQLAIDFACRALGTSSENNLRLIRIQNTLRLDQLDVSPAVLDEIKDRPDIEILTPLNMDFPPGKVTMLPSWP